MKRSAGRRLRVGLVTGLYILAMSGMVGILGAAGPAYAQGGTTPAWSQLGGLPASAVFVNALAPLGSVLYAGTEDGVWAWDGIAWSPVGSVFATGDITALAASNGTLYAATLYGGGAGSEVWQWDGTQWSQIGSLGSQLPATATVMSLLPESGALYAATSAGAWASTSQSSSWSQVGSLPSGSNVVSSLAAVGGSLYAGTDDGVYGLQGGSWTLVGNLSATGSAGAASHINTLADVNGELTAGTADNIWTWNGSTWSQQIDIGTVFYNGGTRVNSIAQSGPDVYVNAGSGGVWAWNGTSWAELNAGPVEFQAVTTDCISALAIGGNGLLYAGADCPSPDTAADNVWQLGSAAAASPSLLSLAPGGGAVGAPVTLAGWRFGTVAGSVYFQQGSNPVVVQAGSASAWTDTSLTVPVPSGVPVGQSVSVSVYNTQTGLLSNALPFDVAQPMIAGLLGFTPSAPASVSPGQVIPVTFSATDTSGDPIPYAELYVSFVPTTGGGTAFWGTRPLSATPMPIVADASGQVVLSYVAPATEPRGGGIDVMTVADAASSPSISVTDNFPLGAAATGSTTSAGLDLAAPPGGALMPGAVGMPYSFPLFALGGTPPYTFSLIGGSLPAGFSLNSVTGAVYGTPRSTGSSNFTVQVQDSSSLPETASAALSLQVVQPGTLGALTLQAPNPLPPAVADIPYFFPVLATGGTPPYTFSVTSGSLPAGLGLNTVTGAVYGTPTSVGTSSFTISVTDSASVGTTVSAPTSLQVMSAPAVAAPPPPFTPPTSVPTGVSLAFPVAPALVGQQEPIFVAVGSGSGPTSGATVSFSTSGGTLSATSATTGAQGIASVLLTDSTAETDTVTFSAQSASQTAQVQFVNPLTSAPTPFAAGFKLPPTLPGFAQGLTAALDGSEVEVTPPSGSSLSGEIPDFDLILSGLSDPTTVAASVYSVVYGLTQAQSLFSTSPDVSLLGTQMPNVATFLAGVFSFSNPTGNLASTLFNDSATQTSAGIEVTLPFNASALPAGATPEVVWLDSSQSPAVWTNRGVTVLRVDDAGGTITALLPHLSTYTVVGASTSTTSPDGGGGGYVAPALPTVTAISPSGGPAAGGTVVTITGTNFAAPATVDFGPNEATGVTVESATEIQATSPAGTATVDVTVTTSAGTSATDTADQFAYTSAPAVSFSDVAPGYWAYGDIEALAAKGIVTGFPDGTFQPGAVVTRAQFVKMLDLTLGLKPGSGAISFTDVPASAWYAPYVAAAVQAGIVSGLSPTTFGPAETLTREQMAVLLARVLKLTQAAPLHFTDDAAIDAWAMQGVEETVAAGYMNGFPNGSFQPAGATTRAQAAKVLAMVLQHTAG